MTGGIHPDESGDRLASAKRRGLLAKADKEKLDAYPEYTTAPTITDFTSAQHDHLDADDGGTLSAAAIASGNLDNARLPAGGTDANGWAWWYYAPGKKMYSQRFLAISPADPNLLVANDAALPVDVTDFANLRIVGVEHDALLGGSAINSAVRQGSTATTIDVTSSTTDGSNLDSKDATFSVDVTLRDA